MLVPDEAGLVSRRGLLTVGGGAAIGAIGGLGLLAATVNAGQGTRILVIGAGKRLSAMIVHDQRRILIASGSDGATFESAVRRSIPLLRSRIDIILIDSGASNGVQERALNMASHKTWWLGETTEQQSNVIRSATLIELGTTLTMRVIPAAETWQINLAIGASRIDISASGGASNSPAPVLISLDGSAADGIPRTLVVGPAGTPTGSGHVAVGPGTTRRLNLTATQVTLEP